MARFSWRNKDKIQNIAIAVLAVTTVLSVGTLIVTNVNEDTKVLKASNFEIASVADDGDLVKDGTTSLVSGFVNAEDLQIEIAENAVVTYKVHYYDEDKEWVSSTVEQSVDYALEMPETAEYARVEITPIEDNYISVFEKAEYASQIKVTVEK